MGMKEAMIQCMWSINRASNNLPFRNNGFTLIELMVVVAIIGILAVIVYPSYQSNLRKAKRNDAIEALLRIQVEQEKWRISDTDYATLAELGNPVTADGYYDITIPVNTTTGYTIRATATGDQLNDNAQGESCSPLEIVVSAGGESKTPTVCW